MDFGGDNQMGEDELMKLSQLMGTTPVPDDKQNLFNFINNVIMTDDTTRVGNVTIDELGNPQHPIRTCEKLALISGEIMENDFYKGYFNAESEITTATSLSKEGFLIKQAVTQKREIADTTKRRKPSSSWFKKKDPSQEYNPIEG